MYFKLETQTEQERIVSALKGWQWDRKQHGCLYDRGSADSYYGRQPAPHYGGVGGDSGQRVPVSDAASIAEYQDGYDDNERRGDHKDWQ